MTRAERCIVGLVCVLGTTSFVFAETGTTGIATTTETILFIRHAEKGPNGLGQLSCKGLNRALAIPAVLKARYGHVDVVFAPDPSHEKKDGGQSYDYVRPLATAEPSAVRFGLPIHAAIGYEEGDKLRAALVAPSLRSDVVLVAWEHHAMNEIVPALVTALGGDGGTVPKWTSDDFDSIWEVSIAWSGDTAKATFAKAHQGLDGQSDVCPDKGAPPLEQASPPMLEHK